MYSPTEQGEFDQTQVYVQPFRCMQLLLLLVDLVQTEVFLFKYVKHILQNELGLQKSNLIGLMFN